MSKIISHDKITQIKYHELMISNSERQRRVEFIMCSDTQLTVLAIMLTHRIRPNPSRGAHVFFPEALNS